MKQPTAQEIIDLPDNINRVEIGQWYTKRMRELNPKPKKYGRTYTHLNMHGGKTNGKRNEPAR